MFSKVVLVKEKGAMYDAPKIVRHPQDAVTAINEIMQLENEAQEVFGVMTLDIKNKITTSIHEVTRGSVSSSIVHPREVFKIAILHNASSIILFHNHPSGDPTPSQEDVTVTKKLKEAGNLMQIEILDSVIIGDERYRSLKEDGVL